MDNGYTAIDLFAGAGGLSLGFEQAGFRVELAVEKDAWAVETYKANHLNTSVIESDVCSMKDSSFIPYRGKIDVVMGGPPCQGYSIAASNRRRNDDDRNVLYREFLRVVEIVNPKIVLIENVKEIIRYKLPDGTRILDDIIGFFDKHGYLHDYGILNCKNYGVPQDRKRFFFLAVRNDVMEVKPHLEELMSLYRGMPISFNEAISDLPPVRARQYPEDAVLDYLGEPSNAYQEELRRGSEALHNHIPMRHTDKTVQKFEFLLRDSGAELPKALLPRVRGDVEAISTSSYSQNHRVIDGSKVSPTITASFYSSFIHPSQPRNLTVREAARIQSFPDTFVFKGKRTTLSKKLLAKKGIIEELHLDQFNQVGNAVPPLMAKHLAGVCLRCLNGGQPHDFA